MKRIISYFNKKKYKNLDNTELLDINDNNEHLNYCSKFLNIKIDMLLKEDLDEGTFYINNILKKYKKILIEDNSIIVNQLINIYTKTLKINSLIKKSVEEQIKIKNYINLKHKFDIESLDLLENTIKDVLNFVEKNDDKIKILELELEKEINESINYKTEKYEKEINTLKKIPKLLFMYHNDICNIYDNLNYIYNYILKIK